MVVLLFGGRAGKVEEMQGIQRRAFCGASFSRLSNYKLDCSTYRRNHSYVMLKASGFGSIRPKGFQVCR
jgi:hypothetical protein